MSRPSESQRQEYVLTSKKKKIILGMIKKKWMTLSASTYILSYITWTFISSCVPDTDTDPKYHKFPKNKSG